MIWFYLDALLICISAAVAFLIKRVYFHPLSHFPGPRWAATSEFFLFYILWSGRAKAWYRDLHQRYGPVVRCGPNHLSFNDPDMVSIVYHRQSDKIGQPPDFTCPGAAANKWDHAGFTAAKRQFGQAYSLSKVKVFEGVMDEQLGKWMAILQEEAAQNPSISQEKWITYARFFGYDVFTPISFGESLGFLDSRNDIRGLIDSAYKLYPLQTLSRYPLIAWIARNTALGRRMFARLVSRSPGPKGVGLYMDEVHKVVQKRRSSEKPKYENSMLDQWLVESKAIPVTDIEDQLVADWLGGPYAASLAFTGVFFQIVGDQNAMQRLRKEVDEAFKSQTLTSPMPTYEECSQLPFVSACINEALRCTSTASPRGRCSPDRSFTLDGKYVPPGTAIATSPSAISTSKKLYGDDADAFRPDRWLEASEEQVRVWKTFDAHWGFGVRKCPGRHIGFMIVYKALVQLLRQFDVQVDKSTASDTGTSLLMIPRKL